MNRHSTAENAEDAETVKNLNELTDAIIGAAIEVHRALGLGLLESTYEMCLCQELSIRGLRFERQVSIPIEYKGVKLECGYRAGLTMIGITIGVFSVISVMTAIGALQSSIESGISFLGANIFQFAKYPANVNVGGEIKKKYQNRRNITYREALHYSKLMEGNAREVCLKSFGYEVKGQAVYNGIKTTPSLLIVGTNRSFLAANAYTLGYGRNLNDEDVDSARRVIVVGKVIEKRLFPHETPIGKVIRLSGHTYTIIGVLAEKGTSFGQSQDDLCIMPITRFFEDYGEAKRTVNIATQSFSHESYNGTLDKGIGAMRIARGLRADPENDFEIYSNDSLKIAFTS